MQTGCSSTSADTNAQLRADLDAAIEYAADYLETQQAENGSWPSQTYGLFRDGVALTPHVLRALANTGRNNETMKQGFSFLAEQVSWTRTHPSRPALNSSVRGPVYFMADTQIASNRCPEHAHTKLNNIHVGLPRLQITNKSDLLFAQRGGWGYDRIPFAASGPGIEWITSFDHGESRHPIYPNLSANISATVYALDAIPSEPYAPLPPGVPQSLAYPQYEEVVESALRFVMRCQNFDTGDNRFDDGGFFFNPADATRNKGGPSGTDKNGYARFHSSGSSTADGLRVLLLCRFPQEHPRFIAARDWLFKHFDPEHNPGTFNDDREVLRDAYYFYYAASVADTFTLLGDGPDDWAQDLTHALLQKQQADGSFANPFTDGKEDDPLIATPFALRAMVKCRDELVREK